MWFPLILSAESFKTIKTRGSQNLAKLPIKQRRKFSFNGWIKILARASRQLPIQNFGSLPDYHLIINLEKLKFRILRDLTDFIKILVYSIF